MDAYTANAPSRDHAPTNLAPNGLPLFVELYSLYCLEPPCQLICLSLQQRISASAFATQVTQGGPLMRRPDMFQLHRWIIHAGHTCILTTELTDQVPVLQLCKALLSLSSSLLNEQAIH